ncbi:MAG: hypothetical protein NUV80_05605 [Candidatus Berkelbacteria bacterium]|nr:hypothetical protein [Candidatus Berkelbacteria bacterium]
MSSILILRVLLRPLILLVMALAIFVYLKAFVAGSFSESRYLVGLVEAIQGKAIWVASIPFAVGAFSLVDRLQLLYWWHSDDSQGCDNCGGPQDQNNGRHGPFRKCFHCGATKSGWQ